MKSNIRCIYSNAFISYTITKNIKYPNIVLNFINQWVSYLLITRQNNRYSLLVAIILSTTWSVLYIYVCITWRQIHYCKQVTREKKNCMLIQFYVIIINYVALTVTYYNYIFLLCCISCVELHKNCTASEIKF
jgi:hypothetical protein